MQAFSIRLICRHSTGRHFDDLTVDENGKWELTGGHHEGLAMVLPSDEIELELEDSAGSMSVAMKADNVKTLWMMLKTAIESWEEDRKIWLARESN